ncbi:hypothetical protein K7X08_015473 [Anisodus acutangulus]|uniref:Uncharacterized protein n=1 Tax=Anisodus acutangulus TaxID=402998 RepID=A0A9Q1L683_9SOLA|nr:hypothetical protein K7X08_015473 [Anisodus acutangulus]
MDTLFGKAVDFGVKNFKSISDFDENLETLERNVKLLSDRAFDVKTDVENRERSGKKKRKREVGSWFDEVMKVEEGLHAFKEEVTRGKKNGGSLEKMNGRVGELLEQSKHFGMLVHDMKVQGNSRQEEFNQGHTILNKLAKVCLLEATYGIGYASRRFEAVKMHDLLREIALRITNVKPKYMVWAGIGSQKSQRAEGNCICNQQNANQMGFALVIKCRDNSEQSKCVESINGLKQGRWKATLSFYKPMLRGYFVQGIKNNKYISEFVSMDGCSEKNLLSDLPVEALKTKNRFFNHYNCNMKIEASSKQGILCCTSNDNHMHYICKPSTQE